MELAGAYPHALRRALTSMARAARRLRLGISQPAWLASSSVASPCGHCRARGPHSAPRGSMSSDESPNVPAERDRRDAVREKAQQVQAQQSRARVDPHDLHRDRHRRRRRDRCGRGDLGRHLGRIAASAQPCERHRRRIRRHDRLRRRFRRGIRRRRRRPRDAVAGRSADRDRRPPPLRRRRRRRPSSRSSTSACTSTTCPPGRTTSRSRTSSSCRSGSPRMPRPSRTTRSRCSPPSRTARSTPCARPVPPHASRRTRPTPSSPSTTPFSHSSPRSTRTATPTWSWPTSPSPPARTLRRSCAPCIEEQAFASWAKSATERALQGLPDTEDVALTGTPMVLVNGMPYVGALDDPKEFAQFVLTIASDAYYKTPTATPTPT